MSINIINSNKITVGLDLGTDKCCLSYQDLLGRPFIITDDTNYKISSIIGILNNGLLVGNDISKNLIYDIPIITNLKRLIGHISTDIDAINIALYHKWILKDSPNDLIIIINSNEYLLSNLICILLQKIKLIIISSIGNNFNLIITIPANFNEGQKNFILNLCKIVDIECKRFIYEPCSAALAYINYFNPDNNLIESEIDLDENILKRIAVFDFGAGTLDLAIITCNCLIENDKKEWMAKIETNIGDNNLGGLDIDIQLGKYLQDKFPDFKQLLESKNESITFIVEKIKIKLSNLYDNYKLSTVSLVERYYNQIIVISIEEYFNLLDKYFKQRIINLIDKLHHSYIKKTDIDNVLLIGGSCYNPWIKILIEDYYTINIKTYNLFMSDHLKMYNLDIRDIGVSLGATCIDRKINKYSNSLIITESLPLSIGIATSNNIMCPLLLKDTLIPCSTKKYFTTSEDNQKFIEIKLYQGERNDIRENFFLGSFIMDDLDEEPQGKVVIIVNISISTDGIITIEGKVKNTEKFNKKIIINRYDNNLDIKLIESNIRQYELNDIIFSSIMCSYYQLITMLNKLQYNLLDNINCNLEYDVIHNIFLLIWDDIIEIYKLMSQSDKIKSNIQQLNKFILYIKNKMNYNINENIIDYTDDKIIVIKLDKLNKFMEKNLQYLVSTYQIKVENVENCINTKYDTIENDIILNEINSITNPTEILNYIDKELLSEIENLNNKSNYIYIKEIKDLSMMIVNDIESLSMKDINKLLILEIFNIYESYIDIISVDNFDGKKQLEIIQNICLIISNIENSEYIENIQLKLEILNQTDKLFIYNFEQILNEVNNYKITNLY